jgi:hypothetical protein
MAIWKGQHIKIDYGNLEHNEELDEAMETLDHDCANGIGGVWELYKEAPDEGTPYRAVFAEMATDELVWLSRDGIWSYGNEIDEEEEEDIDRSDPCNCPYDMV